MNIDERIEALTQSVELLASFHRDLEAKLDRQSSQMTDLIGRLVSIVEDHERRINGLEGK